MSMRINDMFLLIGLTTIMIIGWWINYLIMKEIKSITTQLKFIKNNKTNMIVTSTYRNNSTLRNFTNQINAVINESATSRQIYITKDETLKNTLTSLAHDIRTPLTSLDGYFQLLLDSPEEGEKEQYQKIIKEEIDCLRNMTDTLFTYTKLQNRSYKFDVEKCCINNILLECLFGFYQKFRDEKIEPNLIIEDENQLFIMGNEIFLKRIFQNLIKNSIEHGNGDLKVVFRKIDNAAAISFINHFNNENLNIDEIFQMFYKSDRSRSFSSTGLGLAIVKELVERFNGKIEVETPENQFKIDIYFPIIY